MTEIQRITLRDVFRQQGLSERKIEDVMLLLQFKPEKVQLAFYYTAIGKTQAEIGDILGCSQQSAGKIIASRCEDLRQYLKKNTTNLA